MTMAKQSERLAMLQRNKNKRHILLVQNTPTCIQGKGTYLNYLIYKGSGTVM